MMGDVRICGALAFWTTSSTLLVCGSLGWMGAKLADRELRAEPGLRAIGPHTLEHRLASLRSDLSQLEAKAGDPLTIPTRVSLGSEVETRLGALEHDHVATEDAAESDPQVAQPARTPKPDSAARAVELGQIASDASRSPEERVDALRRLRALDAGETFPDGDARTPEVVQSLLDSILASRDTSFQVDVIKNLSGTRHELLRDPLLHFLQSSADPRVREEAAETLHTQLSDPRVVELLRWTAESDPSERVRLQARRTLSKLPGAPSPDQR